MKFVSLTVTLLSVLLPLGALGRHPAHPRDITAVTDPCANIKTPPDLNEPIAFEIELPGTFGSSNVSASSTTTKCIAILQIASCNTLDQIKKEHSDFGKLYSSLLDSQLKAGHSYCVETQKVEDEEDEVECSSSAHASSVVLSTTAAAVTSKIGSKPTTTLVVGTKATTSTSVA